MKKIFAQFVTLMAITIAIIPTDLCSGEGCSLDRGFWRQHPEAWPSSISRESTIANIMYGDILQTPTNGRPWMILAHEWLTASLNAANSAPSVFVSGVIQEAKELLQKGELTHSPSNLPKYVSLISLLHDYNNGLIAGTQCCHDTIVVVCPPCPACCCPKPECICKVKRCKTSKNKDKSRKKAQESKQLTESAEFTESTHESEQQG